MTLKSLATAAALVAASTTAASADPVFNFGGYVQYSHSAINVPWGPRERDDVELQLFASAEFGAMTYAVGIQPRFAFGDSPIVEEEDVFFVIHGENATLSYGRFFGAGSVAFDDYYAIDDATSVTSETVRFDYAGNGYHVAVSKELNDEDGWELGFATELKGNFVRVGYEMDSQDLVVLTGRDLGAWGYHVVGSWDFDGGDREIGFTVLGDITDKFRVAAHAGLDEQFELETLGLSAWYDLAPIAGSDQPVTLSAQLLSDEQAPFEDYEYEFRLNVPFGNALPSSYERMGQKRFVNGRGYF